MPSQFVRKRLKGFAARVSDRRTLSGAALVAIVCAGLGCRVECPTGTRLDGQFCRRIDAGAGSGGQAPPIAGGGASGSAAGAGAAGSMQAGALSSAAGTAAHSK